MELVHVPQDLVFNHILPRVPAESVGRFKYVSKEWHAFLTSDVFKNKHNLHVDNHQNNLKLLVLYRTKKASFKFTTIDCEAAPSDKGLVLTRRRLPQFGHTNPQDIHILTSFHGLVCLGIIKDIFDVEYSDLILWNPGTNEFKRLSKFNPLTIEYIWYLNSNFGLYYSCCDDDYKLLFVNLFHDDVYIYSLRSDSWRKVDVFQHTSQLYPGGRSGGTYLNENLYFLQQNSSGRLSSIIRFDTKTERLSKIDTPYVNYRKNASHYFATIMVKSDCIHVCVKYERSGDNCVGRTTWIKLWKLDEYGSMKEMLTYKLSPHVYDHTISSLIPFHFMKNGNWLMLKNGWSSYSDRIYKVDLKKNMHITNKGKEKGNIYDDIEYANVRMHKNSNINKLVDKEVRYIATFVSPNRYMK